MFGWNLQLGLSMAVVLNLSVLFTYVIALPCISICQTLPEKISSDSGCYSPATLPYIQGNCSSGELIAPFAVYAGTKNTSTGCNANGGVPVGRPDCCVLDYENDCVMSFVHTDYDKQYIYHNACIGREMCLQAQVQWMPVDHEQCNNQTEYPDDTFYLTMFYYCIESSRVSVLPNVSISTNQGNALYLLGQEYPGYMEAHQSTCTVNNPGGNNVDIQAIHIGFTRENDICQQMITIVEFGSAQKVISCDDNNNYTITKIYSASSNNVTLQITSLRDGGQFWLGLVSNGILTLDCQGNSPTTETSTSTSTSISTSAGGPTTTPSENETTSDGSTVIIIAAVVALLFIIVILVVAACIYKHKKKSAVAPANKKEQSENLAESDNISLPGLFMPAAVGTAPVITTINSPPMNRLPPLTAAPNDEPRKKKKKKKKRKKNKIENTEEDGTENLPSTADL